ncbi:MAG: bifunctional oligoribonuclease/PAP phosphatase NrnA [Oscillospiraceae bacterium]|nr:bifunctional oligoribonuclease/PAP phosphatase NrnA [Oscillospiraceae bacterium]
MFHEILSEIKRFDRIIIHRHSKPDGDAIGSQIGLKHIIRENFPEKEVFVVGDGAGHYSFIPDSVMDEISDDMYTDALAIVLDCGASSLISDDRYRNAKRTARMDHHIFCEKICDTEVVETSYESCCGMVADLALTCSLRLNPTAAQALYTGMITDSGRFRYDSTSSRTFRLASFLMEQKFDTNEIFRNLYADDFESKKLRAQFTLKVQFTEHNVAYIYTTLDELKTLNKDIFSVSRGMVGIMSDTKGVDIWVNFTETENGVLCEIRSSRFNINPIAAKYGGGGHAKASGATLPNRETAMQMLRDLDNMITGEA